MPLYSYRSSRFLLPRPQSGDYLDSTEERRVVDIIDRTLQKAIELLTNAEGNGIVSEGDFSSLFVTNHSSVTLSATSEHPALFAFIHTVPVYTEEDIIWPDLANNTTYYLYAALEEDLAVDPEISSRRYGDVAVAITTVASTNPEHLLIAIVTTTTTSLTIQTNPTGKTYLYGIEQYDTDRDGIIDNAKTLDGQTLDYVLNRANHLNTQPWNTIDTSVSKVSATDLEESERASLRFFEAFENYAISGDKPAVSTSCITLIPAQSASVHGIRIVTSDEAVTFDQNKDTYVDLGSDGFYYYKKVARGAAEPTISQINTGTIALPVYVDCYRLFKVTTTPPAASSGSVTIQRRPAVGNTITLYGFTFIAVATAGEIDPLGGDEKFWIGSADTPAGWVECATSFTAAINSSQVPCTAAVTGVKVALTYVDAGPDVGDAVITLVTAAGIITAKNMSGGHWDMISEVVDLRTRLNQYWRNPVATATALATITNPGEGETRLVLDENDIYRYSTTQLAGSGSIIVSGVPVIGDKIYIGGTVIEAATAEDPDQKYFLYTDSVTSIAAVVNASTYPASDFIALADDAENTVNFTTKGIDTDYNDTISSVINSTPYIFSGISNTGRNKGWVKIGATSTQQTSTFNIYKEGYTAAAGQTVFPVLHSFTSSNLFVYRAGAYKRKGEFDDYVEVTSGIQFNAPCVSGVAVDFYILELRGDLAASLLDNAVARDVSFLTVYKEDRLPNSFDLETHSTFHSEVNHDSVPISDPGTLYTKNKTYEVLADHIYDDAAHMNLQSGVALGSAISYPVEFPFYAINNGGGVQTFEIEGSPYKDFATLTFDYSSANTPVIEGKWEFEAAAGTVPWQLSYDSSAVKINDMAAWENEVYAAGDNGEIYRNVSSGISSVTIEYVSGISFTGGTVTHLQPISGLGLFASIGNSLFLRDAFTGVWSYFDNIESPEILSLSNTEGDLWVGSDGEAYTYVTSSNSWYNSKAARIDIPVYKITAISEEYNGMVFVGTEGPARIYKVDGSGVSVVQDLPSEIGVTDFEPYAGRLYASTHGLGKVYVTSGVGEAWTESYNFADTTINKLYNNSYDGLLYAAGSSGKIYRCNNVTWYDEYDLNAAFGITEVTSLITINPYLFAGTGNTGQIYERITAAISVGWTDLPTAGIDTDLYEGSEIKFILNQSYSQQFLTEGIRYIRYRQYDGIAYSDWEYAYPLNTGGSGGAGGSGGDAIYNFFRSPGTAGFGIDGFKEVYSTQTINKIRVRLANVSSTYIYVNVKRNETPVIAATNGLVVNPGDYFAETTSPDITSLAEDDILTCDITQGDDIVTGINVSVRAGYISTLTCSTPIASPAGGNYGLTQSVSLYTATPGADIYYTINGSTPNSGSTLYTVPIVISAGTTLRSIAIKSGYVDSNTMTEIYTFSALTVSAPTASPSGGTYYADQTVTLSCLTAGASIYYTTNGTTPTSGSTLYTGLISITAVTTLKAVGIKSGYADSTVMTEIYTLTCPTPIFSPSGGSYSGEINITITN